MRLPHPEMTWSPAARRLLDDVMRALEFTDAIEEGRAEYWFIEAVEAYTRRQKRTEVTATDAREVIRAAVQALAQEGEVGS
jgi:hypothetical protein